MKKATIDEQETSEVLTQNGIEKPVLVRWFYNPVKDRIRIVDVDRKKVKDSKIIGQLRARLRMSHIYEPPVKLLGEA